MKIMVWMTGLFLAVNLALANPPRIISLGGAITETVWALDGGDLVVAVDDSSQYPGEAANLPKVGYYRMISAEGVLSLRPDLILAHQQSGPPEAMTQLERAGARIVRINGTHSIDGCLARVREVGLAIGKTNEANALVDRMEEQLASLPPQPDAARGVLFIFARGAGALNVSGTGTAADTMIRLAGGRNVMTEFSGYRPLTAEAVVVADPEVILMTSDGARGMGGVDAVWDLPGIKATTAYQQRRAIVMDDLLLLGFGPRLPEALRTLREKLAE
jgi:iron complex transport system substrate-binding protein